ncbi:MAG TPA: sigma 54-interacting transcriptional regulator [Syntrophomonadaceae bacterium]|nr:sigma 54-interacting transcriptional regulator [Syntrophomonadaceae bacterium]
MSSEKLSANKKFCSREDLKQVIINSYDAIMVTDGTGNIILCNPATGKLLDVNPQELIGKNVRELVAQGVYDQSIAYQALETRSVVTGLLVSRNGTKIMCTGTPVFNENREVSLVIVNSRDNDIVEKYLKALDNERMKAVRYKTAAEYLNEKDSYQVVAKSKKMRDLISNSSNIAQSDSTVMLFGESGSGKEVVARYIHRNSPRAKEPFIPVNCAAIPAELLESEFFGYVSGAFTGANTKGKAGIFEIAHKGTLFLDEIGEMPLPMQSKLLRVIETGQVQRLGSTNVFQTNIRLIAATNRDLQAMVDQKLFRSDLYYRLNVIPLYLPPLRERPEDIIALAEKFLEEFNRKYAFKKEFSPRTIRTLLDYSWPGNVRELRNVIERLVVTSTNQFLNWENDAFIDRKACPEEAVSPHLRGVVSYQGTLKSVLKAVEEEYINQVLAECNGRIGEAAQRLGIHRTMLYRKTRAIL